MNKQMVRLGVIAGALACGAGSLAIGCFNSQATTPNATSGSAGGGASGASGGGSSGASGAASGGGGSSTVTGGADGGPEVILDDMTMPQSETGGSWYTYSDRTVANSEPPIPLMGAMGTLTPMEGASFMATMGANSPMITEVGMTAAMALPYRECSGGGETVWGAGFGFDIISATPDGGAVKFNSCGDAGMIFDTSGKSPNVGIPQPYNAMTKGYTGVAFYGQSFGMGAVQVAIQFDDATTSPWAGQCDPCRASTDKCTGGMQPCPCSDSFIETFSFPAGSWKRFAIHWKDIALARSGWSGLPKGPGTIDPSTLYNFHFQLTKGNAATLPNFDVGVAYITWLTD